MTNITLNLVTEIVDLLEPIGVSAVVFYIISMINNEPTMVEFEQSREQRDTFQAFLSLSKLLTMNQLKEVKQMCLDKLMNEKDVEHVVDVVYYDVDDDVVDDNGDCLPYPVVTKKHLDKELDKMQKKREKHFKLSK